MSSDPGPVALTRRSVLALSVAGWCNPAAAQDARGYPGRPVQLVVGFPPGGSVDRVGRVLAEMLARRLNGPVVVENLGGAAGAIGAQKVVSSAADGYTLLVGSNNELAITGLINKAQRYEPIRDFTPIGLVSRGPALWVGGPAAAVKDLDESLRSIRRNPGKFSYGSAGVGSLGHFAGEMLKQRAGLFMPHIPYRGVAPLVSDLVGGRIEYAVMSPAAALAQVQAGRLMALGVTTAGRVPGLPDVPALGEHRSLRGYELDGWFALMAPAGLPASIQTRLRDALKDVLKDAELRRKLAEIGGQAASGSEDLSQLMLADRRKLEELVKFAHISE